MGRKQASQDSKSQNITCSVIVPTYKECNNLKPLTERLFAALKKHQLDATTELIIVDDNSRDGSEQVVNTLSETYPVRIIVRTKDRGLSSAVLHGFREAASNAILICMDADLQHPPEKVPEMIQAMTSGSKDQAQFAIGTRYAGGESIDKDWPLHRRVISSTARLMARPLTPLSDPMTGFFAIRKDIFDKYSSKVNPIGFKICLELYVKCQIQRHAEVPIVFGVRTEGESKLTGKVIVNYINHLFELYSYQMPWFLVLLVLFAIYVAYMLFQIII